MPDQLTLFEDPQGASAHKNLVVYRSSAGSGKTFALVKEYLKIVLRDPNAYKHILAITFTNKATEEMKQRIIKELTDLSAGNATDMLQELKRDFEHFSSPLNIQSRAIKALNNIIHDYSRFEVSTIDHFFSQLVRLLARELKLSFNYEIDVDEDQTMREALDRLYADLHQTPEWLKWLEEYAFSQLDDDKGWQLDRKIMQLGKELFKERFHQSFSRIKPEEVNLEAIKTLINQLKETEITFKSNIRIFANNLLNLIKYHGLVKEDFKYSGSGTISILEKFIKIGEQDYEIKKRLEALTNGEDDWHKKDSLNREKVLAISSELGVLAMELIKYHQGFYSNYITAKALLKNIYAYGLLEVLYEKWQEYQKEKNLLLLSQNSFLLRDVIQDKDAPFLYEKMGSRFQHLLIDEFQDTSVYQWKNLKPLVVQTLEDEHQKVLLVGDVKQSIYRWRGSDMNLLLHKVQEDLSHFQNQWKEERLDHNYRSRKNIVAFNNAFFAGALSLLKQLKDLPSSQKLEEVYREVQQFAKGASGGLVEVRFLPSGDTEETKWQTQALDYTLAVIKKNLKQGANYRDILILVERNEQANQLSEHLTSLGIPIDSDQALKLARHPVIRFLIALLYAVQDPADDLAKAEAAYLYRIVKKQPIEDPHQLFNRAWLTGTGWQRKLHQVETLGSLIGKPLYELVEELVILFDLPGSSFLQGFQDQCLERSAKGQHEVGVFLEWYELHKEKLTLVSPSFHDAVKVMTVHKAKGLEAPVVILPFADFSFSSKGIFWSSQLEGSSYHKFGLLPLEFSDQLVHSHFKESYQQEILDEVLERINVVYVAFTRAQERLHIFAPQRKGEVKAPAIKDLGQMLWFIFEQDGMNDALLRQPEPDLYHWGEWEPLKEDKKTEALAAVSLDSYKSQAYQDKVSIRSDAGKFFLLFDHEKAIKIKEGVKLHAVLERLKRISDLPVVLKTLINEGLIERADSEWLQKTVNGLFENPLFASWFGLEWEVFTERQILSQSQIYKPDRVVVRGSEAVVVDYKREQKDSKYEKQVNQYAQLLGNMGYTSVKKYLVYVQDLSIVEVV